MSIKASLIKNNFINRLSVVVIPLSIIITIFYILGDILTPFIVSLIFSYMLLPLVNFGQQQGYKRSTISLWVMIGLIVFIIYLSIELLPILEKECNALIHHLPKYIHYSKQHLEPFIQRLYPQFKIWQSLERSTLIEFLHKHLATLWWGGEQIVYQIFLSGQWIAHFFTTILLTPLITYYFLKDWPKIVHTVWTWLPNSWHVILLTYFSELQQTLSAFVRGQLSVCVLSMLLHSLGLSLLHLEGAIIIGCITGALAFIPYFGAIVGLSIAEIIGLMQFGSLQVSLYILSIFVVIHLIEANILVPYLIGQSIGIHPVWLIFTFLCAAKFLGILGIIIALPLAACISVLIRVTMKQYPPLSPYESSNV